MERVSIIRGNEPILVVAPHGANDINTDYLAEVIADETDGYAVINRGWQRATSVDYLNDLANCNNVKHCHEDVVREEFLEPIIDFSTRIIREHGFCYMYVLHGVGNYIYKQIEDSLDLIIGYGAGIRPSFSCDPRAKDALVYLCENNGLTAYEGRIGGKFSGRSKNNLNQLFRRWYPNKRIQSMQIEVVKDLRLDRETTRLTGEMLAPCFSDLLEFDGELLNEIDIQTKTI